MAFGSSIFDSIEPQLRERMLANGQVFFRTEKDFRTWNPDLTRLRSCGVPIVVAAGRDTKGHPEVGFLYETSVRLAEGLGLPLEEVAGEHVPYVSHPEAFSSELRAILERLGG
jgi:pimeloyl-ACP methyl ester carboxylesterase